MTELSRLTETPEIWLLYLNGLENKMTDVLSYIRDQIEEHGVRFFAIGTPDELEEILKGFPVNDLKAQFARPFRTDDVIDRITMEAMNVEKLAKAKRIMLIDDDPLMLQNFKEMLSGSVGAALRALLQNVLRTPEGRKLAEQLSEAAKRQEDGK